MNHKIFAALSFAFLPGTACIDSPLINHVNADESNVGSGVNESSASCAIRFKKLKLCGKLTWAAPPSTSGYGSFALTLTSESNEVPRNLYSRLAVDLWMPDMGHGSSPVDLKVDTQTDSEDRYTVSRVYFLMPGEWLVRFKLHGSKAAGEPLLDEAALKLEL